MIRVLPLTVALIAVSLMQAHSIEYWATVTDSYRGPAFSVAIEAAALWLWYLRGWVARAFSVLASLLVIGGALLQVSSPLFTSIQQALANEQLLAITRAEIAAHTATLRQYEDNSGKRPGWAPFIEQARTDLDAARARLRKELQQTVNTATDWRTTAGIALQALALLVVMVAQILAVIALRNTAPKAQQTTPAKRHQRVTTPVLKQQHKSLETPTAAEITEKAASVSGDEFDQRVVTLAKAIRAQLPNFDGKQRLLAEHLNIRPADISMALNHMTRKPQGKEIVSESAVQRMEEALIQ